MSSVSKKKNRMVSMRITEDQYQYLEQVARRIRKRTGFRVTRASIILKMMEFGLPFLEQEFPPDHGEKSSLPSKKAE